MKRDSFIDVIILIVGIVGIFLSLLYEIRNLKRQLEEKTAEIENAIARNIPSEPNFMYKSPEDGLYEALLFYEVEYPEIVYAQAILETGNFKSNLCLFNNNLFGLFDSKNNRYHRFEHWAYSIKGYKDWVQYKLNPDEDYYDFLIRINYAEDPNYILKLKYLVEQNDKRRNSTGDS